MKLICGQLLRDEGAGSNVLGGPHALQPLERAPVHPPRLQTAPVQYARLPSQSPPDRVRPPGRPVVVGFALASVGQTVALPTGENPATVQYRNAPAAADGRTPPPDARPAKAAASPVQSHRVVHCLPLAALDLAPVIEHNFVGIHSEPDGRRNHVVAGPLPR